ncbi:MAG: DNA primase [Eubacteriales bacterium]|nr:DNA primase [Eubacteriales bacterium]
MIPREQIDDLIDRSDIVEIIGEYVSLKRSGSSFKGLCPFHNERTPSFTVNRERNVFHCFGCHERGNVISFIMKYENLTFLEAVRFLADRAGMTLTETKTPHDDTYDKLRAVNRAAGVYFFKQLRSKAGQKAYDYLRERGMDNELMNRFGLGYAPPGRKNLYNELKAADFSDEILQKSGLFSTFETMGAVDKFYDRVMFPIMDKFGKIVGFGGRLMDGRGPKYLNSPETDIFHKKKTLYGLHLAKRSRAPYMILCEGYMDVITLHQYGFDMAVATLGTAFTPDHATELRKLTKNIYLLYDSDEAGQNATVKAAALMVAADLSVKVIHMPDYKDPDECLQAAGADYLQACIDAAEPEIYFRIGLLKRQFDLLDPAQKIRFTKEAAVELSGYPEEYVRVATEDLIGYFGLDGAIFREMLGVAKVQRKPLEKTLVEERRQERLRRTGPVNPLEQQLLWWMSRQGVYEKIKPYIQAEDFSDERLRRLFQVMVTELEAGKGIEEHRLLSRFETEEEIALAGDTLYCNEELLQLSPADYERGLNENLINFVAASVNRHLAVCDDFAETVALTERREQIKKVVIRIN